LVLKLILLSALCKEYGFENECEYRLLFLLPFEDDKRKKVPLKDWCTV